MDKQMDNQTTTHKSLIEEVVDDLITRMDTLENKESKAPDYNKQFESLESLIISTLLNCQKPLEEMKEVTQLQKQAAEQLQSQLSDVNAIIKEIPRYIRVRYSLDVKAKGLTSAIVSVFVMLALLFGLTFHLWTENDRLKAGDLKYRAIRQKSPEWTHWADTTYARDAKAMEDNTIQLENNALERAEAEAIANQKEDEVQAAKQRLKELKRGK